MEMKLGEKLEACRFSRKNLSYQWIYGLEQSEGISQQVW